jgi:hypothetical protein
MPLMVDPVNSVLGAPVRIYIRAKNKKVPLFEQVGAIKVATLSAPGQMLRLSAPDRDDRHIFCAYINNIAAPLCQMGARDIPQENLGV